MASSAARRYTDAVFGLARDAGTLDQWQVDLDRLGELIDDRNAATIFASPKVTEAEKRAVLDRVLSSAQPETRRLATLLLERGRLTIAPEIAELFREQTLAERGIVVADVTTAIPLDSRSESSIKQRLSAAFGKQVEIRTHVDESIIGGVIARVGDQLIDGSVSSQLKRLRTRLAAGA
jgi:F-type H+-transporting ATPase subunit delta